MATYTTNYNLEKPDASDDFGDFRASYNSNMDTIDQNLGGGGGGGDKHIIVDPNGTTMPTRSKLKFTGSVSVTDDSANNQTVVDITGGGGGGGELYLNNGLIGSDAGVYVTCNLDKTLENGFYLIRVFDSSNSAVGFYEMKWEGTSQVLSISNTVSQGRLEITSTTAGLTYYSGAWRNIYCDILSLGGSGGGSGDTVSWTQIQATGEKIAEITINGTTTDVLIPFEAKIIVTTTTGLTVTATKEGTTYTATETSTGVYEVIVDSKGTWAVTDGTNTTTVSVTAQTTYNVAFVVIPNGSTVTPTDDIQIWLHCANIWDKSYTTLAEVLADTTTLSALISSNNAVDYLVRSTTWAGISLVPTMTSNNTPEGECFANDEYSTSRQAWKAFRNAVPTSGADTWTTNVAISSSTPVWIGYKFTSPTVCDSVAVRWMIGTENKKTTFKVQGSNDNFVSDINDLTALIEDTNNAVTNYTLNNSVAYQYYRLYITLQETNSSGVGKKGYCGYIQFYTDNLCADSTAMTYIGLNNYCANKLLADATWTAAICNSTYFESVLNVKVPVMTSNNTPSGVCSATSEASATYAAWRAFDGNSSSMWSGGGHSSFYLRYTFTKPIKVYCAKHIWFYSTVPSISYKIQGLNSGVVEYESETKTSLVIDPDENTEYISNPSACESWQIYVSSIAYGGYTDGGRINKLQFYGREDV